MVNLFLLIGLLLLLGFFAGVEIAFVSANKLSIELKKKQGKRSSILLSELLERPWVFVGCCILGYGILLVLYGLTVSKLIEPIWKLSGIQKLEGSSIIKSITEVILAVGLVLFFEFLSRAIFRAKSDGLLSFFSGTMKLFVSFIEPVLRVFINTSVWILKYLFNMKIDTAARPFSRIDIEHYYQQTKEASEETQELNQELFENALSLPGIKIRNCLVPRTEVIAMPVTATMEMARKKMIETKLSRLIIYENSIDEIIGYVHQLDMLKETGDLRSLLHPIPTVPETMSVTDLIGKFSHEHKSVAWVVDEFGGTAGIVTMEDLLEEIFGDIRDEYDTEEMVEEKISETEYMLSGRIKIDTLKEKFNLDFPDESETLSGFIINRHKKIPREKEKIIIDDYRFEIVAMSDTKIEQVKLTVL
ncbi:MAG: hemolysin family protein [Chitinophagaceae bacterium]|jgi:CBS domain containing-hemolysin-like protein|nr:hemolysin family protein [Chitinophagaceae bacterium]